MENKEVKNVPDIPYIAFESSQARMERVNKKLWIVILVLIVTLIGTNAGWLWWESQWAYVKSTTEIEAEQDGDNNIVGGGDINYGTESQSNEDNAN